MFGDGPAAAQSQGSGGHVSGRRGAGWEDGGGEDAAEKAGACKSILGRSE